MEAIFFSVQIISATRPLSPVAVYRNSAQYPAEMPRAGLERGYHEGRSQDVAPIASLLQLHATNATRWDMTCVPECSHSPVLPYMQEARRSLLGFSHRVSSCHCLRHVSTSYAEGPEGGPGHLLWPAPFMVVPFLILKDNEHSMEGLLYVLYLKPCTQELSGHIWLLCRISPAGHAILHRASRLDLSS